MPIISAVGVAVGNHFNGDTDLAARLEAKILKTIQMCQAKGLSDEETRVEIQRSRQWVIDGGQ